MSSLELVYVDASGSIPAVGTILDGKYRVDGPLGKGGMAVVLAATHLQLEQRVAIKLLLPEFAENQQVAARFVKEGRSATKIRSEHVVRILDVGDGDGRPYLVMEYLDGTDLNVLIEQGGPLPSVLAVDYVLQACEAIAEAHVLGIVHRDLKPANLFLTHRADGTACVKVLDFGISKTLVADKAGVVAPETSPLLVMGSPHYMSPEQMQSSRDVDARSDLWSLGAIVHELVAGKPPFQGSTITALCAAIMIEDPPVLTSRHGEVPPELAAVVRQCLEKDPDNRFANVALFAAALAPLGSEAAGVSATCIARVLDASSATVHSMRPPSSAEAPATPSDTGIRERTRVGAGRHLGGVIVLLALGSGIGWMVLTHDRVLRDLLWPATVTVASASPAPMVPAPGVPIATAVTKVAPEAPRPPPHGPTLAATITSNQGRPEAPPPASPLLRRPDTDPLLAPGATAAPSATAIPEGEGGTDNPY